jgi:peptidoglycan hydrolase-like protein with peptidoglycan-binding domain
VTELQRRLARAGYYDGAIDGIMGPATRRAIRAYQRDRGS